MNNNFCHEWGISAMIFCRSWKSLLYHLMIDKKSLYMLTHILFYFLHAIYIMDTQIS